MRFDRRTLLRSSTGIATVGFVGTLTDGFGLPSAFAANGTLRISHYGGPYGQLRELAGDPFEAAGHGDIQFEADQPTLIVSKWQAAPDDPIYDVSLMVPIAAINAQKADLITSLSADDIPNLADAIPEALPPSGYGVHQMVDCIDLMYDKRQVSEAPTSWLDMWRPEYEGKIALPAMPLASTAALFAYAISKSLGHDEHDMSAAYEKIKELKDSARLFYSNPNQVTQLIERGEIAMAPQYGARIAQAQTRSDFVGRATPEEGVPASPQTWSIAKGSPHQDMAKQYINFVISQPVQQQLAETFLLAPVNKNVVLPEDLVPYVLMDHSQFLWIDYDLAANSIKDWSDIWAKEVQS